MRSRGAAAIVLCALAVTPSASAQQERVFRTDRIYHVPVGDSASRGPDDALVTIVEFSDFRCTACQHAQRTMAEILSLYPGEIRYVYKNYILFGEQSLLASLAAMAAGRQGQFWAMHDRIFTGDVDIDAELLDGYARDLGLDMARWRADFGAERSPFTETLVAEMTLGETLGLNGTPTFFINGRPLVFTGESADFIRAIDDEVKRAKRAVAAGAPRESLYETLIADGLREAGTAHPVGLGNNGLSRGRDDALVTMVLFEDFQCGFCAKLAPTIDELADEYGEDLRIVFRHMPLGGHDDAPLAHEASMAAAAEGKFWEYHDLLYDDPRDLSRKRLERDARKLGLNMKRFRRALDDSVYAAAVAEDRQAGLELGVRGTPTVFINGERVVGAQPIDVFRAFIEAKRAEAERLAADGVPRAEIYETVVGL